MSVLVFTLHRSPQGTGVHAVVPTPAAMEGTLSWLRLQQTRLSRYDAESPLPTRLLLQQNHSLHHLPLRVARKTDYPGWAAIFLTVRSHNFFSLLW